MQTVLVRDMSVEEADETIVNTLERIERSIVHELPLAIKKAEQ